MNKYTVISLFLPCLLLSCLPEQSTGSPRILAYRHLGMNDIQANGEPVHIHFSPRSVQEKIQLLGSLDPLIPDSRIIYIGVLHPEWHTVPPTDAQGNALLEAGEKYRYFDLIHWYVMCPFPYPEGAQLPGNDVKWVTRETLLPGDMGPGGRDFRLEDYMLDVSDGPLSSHSDY